MKSFVFPHSPLSPLSRKLGIALVLSWAVLTSTATVATANTGVGAIGNCSGSGIAPTHQPQRGTFTLPPFLKGILESALQSTQQSIAAFGAPGQSSISREILNTAGLKIFKITLDSSTANGAQVTVTPLLGGLPPERVLSFKNPAIAIRVAGIIDGLLSTLVVAGASNSTLSLGMDLTANFDQIQDPEHLTAAFAGKLATLLMAYEKLSPWLTANVPSGLLLASLPGAATDTPSPLRLADAANPATAKVDLVTLNAAIFAYNNVVKDTPLELLAGLSENPAFKTIGSNIQRLNVAAGDQSRQK